MSRQPLINEDETSPSAPPKEVKVGINDIKERFKTIIGEIPFMEANVANYNDLSQWLTVRPPTDCSEVCSNILCCLTGIGCCYMLARNILVQEGEIGLTMNNGKPELLLPGRHMMLSPLNISMGVFSKGQDLIQMGPITIVRVSMGKIGLAWNNALPEILLPGLHIRSNAAFKFDRVESIDAEMIEFGPIKFLTVRSGGVRVCFANGKVQIFTEGRYAINSGTFVIAGRINTQQTNIRFDKHPVLLDGGINLLVEGLLTYQVVDVEKLIHELGDTNLERTIKDVTKAELARVFAGLHLEQISSAAQNIDADGNERKQTIPHQFATHTLDEKEPQSLLGKEQGLADSIPDGEFHPSAEGETRVWVCNQVVKAVSPLCAAWGVRIKKFQLESTNIADAKYAAEYESASLAIAKAKADLRAIHAQNKIVLASAEAKAQAVRIEAEGKKNASIIEAQGVAEARKIDARARNEAAQTMSDQFAQEFAMRGQQVEFARALKANVLTVVPESAIGASVMSNSMFHGNK